MALESDGDRGKLEEIGKQIAMHVAATAPLSLNKDDLDPDVIAKERAVLVEEAKESGKPDNIIEKMVDGRMHKFFSEVVLMSQSFVINPDLSVEKALNEAAEGGVGCSYQAGGF